jgi:hypothetical protein
MSIKERLVDLVLKGAEVTSVEPLGDRFTLVRLGLPSGSWVPGAKLQVAVDGATLRTYTPVAIEGGAELVVFTHGDGPGARWGRTVQPGPVRVFGPRGSLDLSKVAGPAVFVGDETSVGLALALRTARPDLEVRYLFEGGDDLPPVLHALGIPGTVGVTPTVDAGHDLVLSGNGATIKRLRRELPKPRTTYAKTYWLEGKAGLD